MEHIEQLAADSQLAAVILGNLQTKDYELIAPEPIDPEAQAAFHARGLGFIGCVGVVDGYFRTAFAVPLDETTKSVLVHAFAKYMASKLISNTGDSADWLKRLHTLPDPRTEN